MKRLLHILIFFFIFFDSFSQKTEVIFHGSDTDSSFYHLAKINNNEFWAGGEYGILKKIDSSGKVSSLNFPNKGLNILKIERVQNYVFIVTDNAIIYRYDILKNTYIIKKFPDFKNKCFYDLIALQNGKLLICGGTSGISKGEKKIPRGFIAIIDQDLNEMVTVWKCYRKFVWSLLEMQNGNILASTFNGFNTKIIKASNLNTWEKDSKIKGLVHEIALLENNVWYSGTISHKLKKKGIIGMKENQQQLPISNSQCIWSMELMNGKIISVCKSGNLIIIDKNSSDVLEIKMPTPYSLYDIQKISESKILMAGHGKSMFILDYQSLDQVK